MFSRREFESDFSLTFSKMNMIFIRWQTVLEFLFSIFSLPEWRAVDKQVMMAGMLSFYTCRCDTHARKAKDNRER